MPRGAESYIGAGERKGDRQHGEIYTGKKIDGLNQEHHIKKKLYNSGHSEGTMHYKIYCADNKNINNNNKKLKRSKYEPFVCSIGNMHTFDAVVPYTTYVKGEM